MSKIKTYQEIEDELNLLIQRGFHIPRKDMPQIKSTDVQDFIEYLNEQKIKVKKQEIVLKTLKVTQGELAIDKVLDMTTQDVVLKSKKPIIVSNDLYILDGHHRFAALYVLDNSKKIPCYIVDLKIQDLLNNVKNFDKVFSKALHEQLTN